MVVPAAAVPSGVLVEVPAVPRRKVPALIVVKPVYELAADKVCVPAPYLVRAIGAAITPLKS